MRSVVGVVKDIFLQFCELALDSVEPRRVRGRPDERDQVLSRPTAHFLAFMGREVVEYQKDPLIFGVLGPHALEHVECLLPAFSAS